MTLDNIKQVLDRYTKTYRGRAVVQYHPRQRVYLVHIEDYSAPSVASVTEKDAWLSSNLGQLADEPIAWSRQFVRLRQPSYARR